MTSTTVTLPVQRQQRLGRLMSDWIDPKNAIIAVSLLIGCGLYGWRGLGWATVAIVFAAVLPMAHILYIAGDGTWANRHLTERQQRITVLPVISTSVAVGLTIQAATSAPRPMIALTAAMWATITAIWPVTVLARYKISVHTAVVAGAITMLAQAFSPPQPSTAVREHTVAQVITGAVLGTVVAGTVYAALC